MGRFDYPSPYWDSVGDPALDLIDRMLTVDVEKRYTIDECLEHPWTTDTTIQSFDSTDGLVGAIENLDFSKKRVKRERTMLYHLNSICLAKVIPVDSGASVKEPVKIFNKNPGMKQVKDANGNTKTVKRTSEAKPADNRKPDEFLHMGGQGDQQLFGYDGGSVYSKKELR